MPKIALFIPCYVDQLYPKVGLATWRILRSLDLDVEFPEQQTCCGQPMANSGCAAPTAKLAERFLEVFGGYDQIVCPSGSCTAMVKHHYEQWIHGKPRFEHMAANTYELCEYLVDVLHITKVEGDFPRKVGLHMSCHGLRDLRLAKSSERMDAPFNKPRFLLSQLRGIELVNLARPDECCGFGGTFSVNEASVSCMMGHDRIADHLHAGADVMASFDTSCLMHMEGLAKRNKQQLKMMHVAEILESARLS
jgi:L-lactate dehydrogenase complex protein LldE